MVETVALSNAAIKHGKLKEKDILLLGPEFHRVCAPMNDELPKTFPIIFWDQSDGSTFASWDRAVRSFALCVDMC
jgi:hypothetical protein